MEDLFAFLVRIRLAPPAASWGRATAAHAVPTCWDWSKRLLGERTPQRVALIRRLLSRLHLIQENRGLLYPTPRAREWLRFSDIHRAWSLYTRLARRPALERARVSLFAEPVGESSADR